MGQQTYKPEPPSPLFDSAVQHFQADRLPEAISLFQQVLELDPGHVDSFYFLGRIALQIGNTKDAIDLLRQTIALVEDHAEAHRTLANVLAHTGQLLEAEKHYERALALKPDDATYANLATIYMVGGDPGLALRATILGLKISETPKLKSLFVRSLQHAKSITFNSDLRTYLVRALSEPWQRPGDLAYVSLAILKQDRSIVGAMKRAVERWPERTTLSDLYGQEDLAAVSSNELLRVLLENTQFANIPLERLLTLTRSALLDAVTNNRESVPSDTLGFFCAVAQQCFTNEYVFACSTEERENVDMLGDELATAGANGEPVDPLAVAAFAAYRPLHELTASDAMLDMQWPSPIQNLLTRQVREPLAERALRTDIPKLTPIADETSALVRQQYEENPYPRWVKTAPDITPDTLDGLMQARQPNSPYRPLGKTGPTDILIAGCGTGQQVVEIATSIRNSRVTAVDLSLSSLSYAKYRTDALGLHDISYGQADILELPSLGRSFDLIVCSGVLHHMKDPLRGWRTLLSMLRPNGVMRIALYSEAARTDIVAARELIATRGYRAHAEDIRAARQEIMALGNTALASGVTGSKDFFGTSSCRDLIFHAQEERFTLPRIKEFLDSNELEFLGFQLHPQGKREYLTAFPDDRAYTDLGNWHIFESRNPGFFRGMYQFHVQKKH